MLPCSSACIAKSLSTSLPRNVYEIVTRIKSDESTCEIKWLKNGTPFLEDDLRVSRMTRWWRFSISEETFPIRILSREGDNPEIGSGQKGNAVVE
jgi:hypothetical protein